MRRRQSKETLRVFGLSNKPRMIVYCDGEDCWRNSFGREAMLSLRCLLDMQAMSSGQLDRGVPGRVQGWRYQTNVRV